MSKGGDYLRGFYKAVGDASRNSEIAKRTYSGVHKFVFRVSGGRVWNSMRGGDILLMTSIGCRSGVKRCNALLTVQHHDGYCVIGSNAGGPTDPAWVSNLMADPRAWLTLPKGSELAVRARRVTDGHEWEAIFQCFVAVHDGYAAYVKATSRRLPIFVLEPLS